MWANADPTTPLWAASLEKGACIAEIVVSHRFLSRDGGDSASYNGVGEDS
jgi:hypothetical protein